MSGAMRRLGGICLALSLLLWLPSLPLHCAGRAALVGGFSLLNGVLLGTLLAVITRTRRPLLIYACLGGVLLSFWPLFVSWPPAEQSEIYLPHGAPEILLNYFDILRGVLFLLGVPFPFATLGHHAPDPLPPAPTETDE